MKKFSILLSILLIFVSLCALVSCDTKPAEEITTAAVTEPATEPAKHECAISKTWSHNESAHWHTCTECDRKYDYTAHTPGEPAEENLSEPTPERNGCRDVVIYCTDCNYEISRTMEIIEYNPHPTCTAADAVEENIVPATCIEQGSRDIVVYCTECKKELSRTIEVIALIAHDFEGGAWKGDGEYHWKECKNCTTTDRQNKKGHSGGEATCTQLALCEVCDRSYGRLAEHIFDQQRAEAKYLKATASCTDAAVYFKSCKCGVSSDSETFINGDPLPHDFAGGSLVKVGTDSHATRCKDCAATTNTVKCAAINADNDCTTAEVCTCGRVITQAKAAHDFSLTQSSSTQHWKKCSECDTTTAKENHSGGEATYVEQAVCDICGKAYGGYKDQYLALSGYCIVYSSAGVPYNNSLAATDLQNLIKEATGITLAKYEDRYYSPSYGKIIAIGLVQNLNNITSSLAPTLKQEALSLGRDGYIITKDDKNNIYLCGGGSTGDRNAVYEFLNMYFGFEQFAIGNHSIDKKDSTFKLDMALLSTPIKVKPSIAYRSNGYNGISADTNGNYYNDAHRMNYANNYGVDLLMFVEDGNWNSKSHNSLFWLPYDTYSSHPKWYNTYNNYLLSSSKRDLCYTAHGDATEYQAMIAACVSRVKEILAISKNADKTVLQFGKQDETPICTCTSCTNMKNTYGSYSATVVKFMNDLMAAIEADSSITRRDFNLIFFAYEDFEPAPSGMTLHDRVNVMLAAAYSFNYQASIYDSTNATGRENLQNWSNTLGNGSLFLWTYSSKFNTFMYPTDTFAFYNEDAYKFFADNKVAMFFNQSQGQQQGAVSAWSNLKMYLDASLAWDCTQKQSELIEKYMQGMFGSAAEPMKNFFNSVREACQRDVLMNDYAAQSDGHAYTILGNKVKLNDTKYWEMATIDLWLDYCDEAYGVIEAALTLGEINQTEYDRIKKNIDTEWVSAAFMRIDLYGESGTATVANFEAIAIEKLGMTQCREVYQNNISDLSVYIETYWK